MSLIAGLAVYLTIEDFLLKWLPVSDVAYSLLRQIPDAIVFGLALSVTAYRLSWRTSIPAIGGKADFFLFLFVAWAIIILLINSNSSIFVGLANIKALLRYVLVLYVVIMINPSADKIDQLVMWVRFALGLQIAVGILQLIGGIPARDFLAARDIQEGIGGASKQFTGARFDDVNDLMGTMGDTIKYAYFMLLGLIFRLSVKPSWEITRTVSVAILITLIFLSGSKAVFLTALLFVYWSIARSLDWKAAILGTFSLIGVAFFVYLLILPQELLDQWYSSGSNILQGLLNSRLGIIFYVLPNSLLTPQTLVGFGPDKEVFVAYVLESMPFVPNILLAVLPKVLEDVYWVALYVYYGMIGFFLWCCFVYTVYKRVRFQIIGPERSDYFLGKVATGLIFASIPLNFFNQAFEVRTFSFYLWLFCGLALVNRRRLVYAKAAAP